jgi:hypothetical protein
MPGIVTRRFRIHNAEQFREAFGEAAATNMYLYIARVSAWPDDNNPPTPTDSVQETEYNSWKKMLAAKRVLTSDVTFTIPRYDWTAGKVYREYNSTSLTLHDTPASANGLYVLSSSYNAYKCIFNNKAAVSTVEPTGTSTSTLVTADGYHWKYMYTVDAANALKFLSTNWQPVKTLAVDDGSAQWDVQAAASNGAINIADVVTGGDNYLTNTGTLAAVVDGDTMTLSASASGVDNIYNGSSLYISSGLGSGQVRIITDYIGATKVVQLNSIFAITPNTSSTYSVAPTVTISGDGTGATAYANVFSSGASGNSVNYINMISVGSGYSEATITITANTSHGSSATATAYIAPSGGHGSDPVGELAGHNVILNVQLDGAESGTFMTTNDFRTLGIIRDPLLANGAIATGTSYDQTTQITVSSVTSSGAYTLDETITGGTSGATGKLVSFANTNSANTAGIVRVIDTDGTFTVSETVTGSSSSITATVGSSVLGSLKPYTGDVIYTENRGPISRASDQIEDIKLIVKF